MWVGPVWCKCLFGYDGERCHSKQEETCLNACSGRGECKGTFCHCQAGSWGIDCSLPLSVDHNMAASNTLRIYIYEFPPWLNVWCVVALSALRRSALDLSLRSHSRTVKAESGSPSPHELGFAPSLGWFGSCHIWAAWFPAAVRHTSFPPLGPPTRARLFTPLDACACALPHDLSPS